MTRTRRIAYGMLLTLCLGSLAARAGELTPAAFVACDLQARSATNRGMQSRLSLITSNADAAAISASNAQTEQAVNAVYAAFGTTASLHVAFGTRHAAEIRALVDSDTLLQQEYARIEAEFSALVGQLNQALGRN